MLFLCNNIVVYAKCITAYSAVVDMAIQSTTPCKNGLKPTEANTVRERPAPIKNKVSVKPAFAIVIKYGPTIETAGI